LDNFFLEEKVVGFSGGAKYLFPGISGAEMINATDANGLPLSASLEDYPKDPWGGEYTYELIDGRPQITCLGADNELGGEGENADIIKPEMSEQY